MGTLRIVPWQMPANCPVSRAVEFALAARQQFLVSNEEVLEYVREVEHAEGDEYWSKFANLSGALEDFRLYRKTVEGNP